MSRVAGEKEKRDNKQKMSREAWDNNDEKRDDEKKGREDEKMRR